MEFYTGPYDNYTDTQKQMKIEHRGHARCADRMSYGLTPSLIDRAYIRKGRGRELFNPTDVFTQNPLNKAATIILIIVFGFILIILMGFVRAKFIKRKLKSPKSITQ